MIFPSSFVRDVPTRFLAIRGVILFLFERIQYIRNSFGSKYNTVISKLVISVFFFVLQKKRQNGKKKSIYGINSCVSLPARKIFCKDIR